MNKNIIVKLLIFILVLPFLGIAQQVIITDDASYTSPASGAMLDVKSTTKGFMPPRVALTSLTSASPVTSPVAGLLVYNTATTGTAPNNVLPGIYFWNGTIWTRLLTGGINSTDNLSISTTGAITLNGAATTFNDLVVPVTAVRLGNTNSPTFVVMKNDGGTSRGVWTFTFENLSVSSEQEVFFSIQMPHNWKEGSTIYPHVHWSPQSAGTGAVVWGLEYSWVNYDATTPIAFPNTTVMTLTAPVASGSTDKHLLASFPSITPSTSQDNISSIIMCRFWRKSADAADTFTGNAALLSFDIHYEIDGFGSNTDFIK
jgi:hypothetical protein